MNASGFVRVLLSVTLFNTLVFAAGSEDSSHCGGACSSGFSCMQNSGASSWSCQCVGNGSCDALAPACGQTTTGVDNCGSECQKTGPACPPPERGSQGVSVDTSTGTQTTSIGGTESNSASSGATQSANETSTESGTGLILKEGGLTLIAGGVAEMITGITAGDQGKLLAGNVEIQLGIQLIKQSQGVISHLSAPTVPAGTSPTAIREAGLTLLAQGTALMIAAIAKNPPDQGMFAAGKVEFEGGELLVKQSQIPSDPPPSGGPNPNPNTNTSSNSLPAPSGRGSNSSTNSNGTPTPGGSH